MKKENRKWLIISDSFFFLLFRLKKEINKKANERVERI